MKAKYLFVFFIFLSINIDAQNCQAPISSIVFQQELNELSSVRHDQYRLAKASEFSRHNCLLTYQVKQIAELFNDDVTRLSFVQDAYANIFDKENFYDVYDVFAYFSSVMRLHDFVNGNTQYTERQQERNRRFPESDYNFPKYNYPSYQQYSKQTRCDHPVSDDVFYKLLRGILNQPNDEVKLAMAIQLAEGNCLTVEQIMKMGSLIQKEQKRLDYLKQAYSYTYDIDNYQYSDQLLTDKVYHEEFNNYLRSRQNDYVRRNENHNVHHHVSECAVSQEELTDILASLEQQTFNNTRLTLAKQIVNAKQCFAALQIKQILEVFTFENSKLEMAKYCYAYCIDKDNYYKINDCFTFSSSVSELDEYISTQQ